MVEDELLEFAADGNPKPAAVVGEPERAAQRSTPTARRLVVEFSPGNIFLATVANLIAALIFAVVIWIAMAAWLGVPLKQ